MAIVGVFRICSCELQSETANIVFADVVVEKADWDTSKVREKLRRDIDAHVASVRAAKLSELTTSYQVHFSTFL